MKGVSKVRGCMCSFGMTQYDDMGEGFVNKPTGFMTNSGEIANRLSQVCSGGHRHTLLLKGRARLAQIYPDKLCEEILLGLIDQMRVDGRINKGEVGMAVPSEKTGSMQYWDDLSFNRVIENFVIQAGCPDTPEGFGASDFLIDPEFVPEIKHVYGAVGMGRDDNPGKLSAGCQFYIVHDVEIPRLDQNYTIFGQVFKGLDVLDVIANLSTDANDTPLERLPIVVRALQLNEKEIRALGGSKLFESMIQ